MSASVNFDALAARGSAAIAHLVEKLIDRMDAMEPDCDLEEDDPSAIDTGEDHFGPVIRNGVAFWLQGDDFYLPTPPVYGVDQSLGPVCMEGGR